MGKESCWAGGTPKSCPPKWEQFHIELCRAHSAVGWDGLTAQKKNLSN